MTDCLCFPLGDKGGKSEELITVILNYTKFDSVWYGEN